MAHPRAIGMTRGVRIIIYDSLIGPLFLSWDLPSHAEGSRSSLEWSTWQNGRKRAPCPRPSISCWALTTRNPFWLVHSTCTHRDRIISRY